MANQTITLKAQRINYFGPSPSTKWQNFNWTASGVGPGNGTWGLKSAACHGTSPIQKNVFRTWSKSNSSPLTQVATQFPKNINKLWNKQITVLYAVTDKEESDGKGYSYVFPDRVTNAENEFTPSFTCTPAASTTYTSAAAAATPWT